MRIALVNPSDAKGGAARVALALARGLRARGHEVTYFVENRTLDEPWIESLPTRAADPQSLGWRLQHRLGLNSLNLTGHLPRAVPSGRWRAFDIIHLHDAPMFNWAQLPWLSRQAPLVWTMHTPAAFTGNCIYPYGCERFTKSCGACPQYGKFPLHWLHRDGSRAVMLSKRLLTSRVRLRTIIGASSWISNEARKSLFKRFPIQTILNPVDTEIFKPRDRMEARQHTGLPLDKRIILISAAANPLDTRKGLDIALHALRQLRTPDVVLQPLGINAGLADQNDPLVLPSRHLITDEELNWHYAAADLVWHPSRADTSSMVSLESMASGTPVIAASVGGVPEVIGDGSEAGGLLIPTEDSQALAEATDMLFDDTSRLNALGRQARQRCLHYFTHKQFIDAHESLYHAIFASFSTSA